MLIQLAGPIAPQRPQHIVDPDDQYQNIPLQDQAGRGYEIYANAQAPPYQETPFYPPPLPRQEPIPKKSIARRIWDTAKRRWCVTLVSIFVLFIVLLIIVQVVIKRISAAAPTAAPTVSRISTSRVLTVTPGTGITSSTKSTATNTSVPVLILTNPPPGFGITVAPTATSTAPTGKQSANGGLGF